MTGGAGPVGLISNPHSGHNRDHFPEIAARIARCASVVHVVTDTPAEIDPALGALAAAGVRALAINGGDGTAAAILGRLLHSPLFPSPPPIVLLPGGTANMNAGDIGIRGSLARSVGTLCRWAERGGPATEHNRRALLEVEQDGTLRHGMFLGAGAVIHGTEYAHREIHSRGVRDDLSLALGTARTVWGILRDDPRFNRHVRLGIGLDDGPARDFDTLILAVSTLRRLSFGMRPFFGAGPGAIRLTLFEQGCTRFARTFVSIVRGRPNRNAVPASGYHSHNAARLHLELQGKYNLDGEILEATGALKVRASRPLEFLRP